MKDFKNLGIEDWLKILWRRKWYFLISAVIISSGTVIYALRLPHIYRSETRLSVESAIIPEDYARPLVRSSPTEKIDSIKALLQSRSFLSPIVEEFRLYGMAAAGPNFVMEDAVNALRNNIQVTTAPGNTFTLSFSSHDPAIARDVTSRLAELLIEQNRTARKERVDETDQFLREQIASAEKQLKEKEDEIRRFKSQHLGELPEQSVANMNALLGLNSRLGTIENALQQAMDQRKLLDMRIQEQKRMDILSSTLVANNSVGGATAAAPPPEDAELTAKRAQLAQLQAKYKEAHPDIVRLAAEIREMQALRTAQSQAGARGAGVGSIPAPAKVDPRNPAATVGSVMSEAAAAELKVEMQRADNEIIKRQAEKEQVLGQIKLYQARINEAPALEQELSALLRDHSLLQSQYTSLQGKRLSAQMSSSLDIDPTKDIYTILDDANLPTRAEFPNAGQFALLGILAGLMVGLGAAFTREYFDPTIQSEGEAAVILQLPVLASIPEIARREISVQRRLGKAS